MKRFWLSVLAIVAMLAARSASAETRIALIIGNANYAHVPHLVNPPSDAAAVAAALRQVGFTTVTIEHNLGESDLKAALETFSKAARNADVAVVDYSGHGIEIGGTNYLVPVDARLASDTDVDFEAVPLEMVLHAVAGARRLRLVLLDACRSNPFASTMTRTDPTRAVERGLARVEPSSDTLVVYAAKAGSTASDGNGAVSPFSAAFARDVVQPGIEINKLFRLVHDEVMASTNFKQEPFVYGTLSAKDFYFVPPRAGAAPNVKAASTPFPVADPVEFELALWNSVSASNDIAQLNAYLARYPNGAFAGVARAKIAALSRPPGSHPQSGQNSQIASIPPASLRPLTAADFESVLGLNRNSTLNDAIRLHGPTTGRAFSGGYWFTPKGLPKFLFNPGNTISVLCYVGQAPAPNSAIGRLCSVDEARRGNLLAGFQRSGASFTSADIYINPAGNDILVRWEK